MRLGEIDVLAARFGYAVALGREPADALRADLAECLEHFNSPGLALNIEFGCAVKFFTSNTSSLFALIECVVPALNGGDVLIEVVVTSNGPDKYATLEQISAVN